MQKLSKREICKAFGVNPRLIPPRAESNFAKQEKRELALAKRFQRIFARKKKLK